MKVTARHSTSKPRLLRLLDEIEGAGWCRGSLYLTPSSLASRTYPTFGLPDEGLNDNLRSALDLVSESETGIALFLGDERATAVMPPFPMEEDLIVEGLDSSTLVELLNREFIVGVVLLRLGRYAVGVLRGEYLSASKTDTRHVKNRHRAGGQSQRRFERSRERLVRELFDKACAVTGEVFTPFEDSLDYILMGGEGNTLRDFVKRCRFLSDRQSKILARTLDIDRPNNETIQNIAFEVWRSRVIDFATP